jgi:hypothetical protein
VTSATVAISAVCSVRIGLRVLIPEVGTSTILGV